MAENSSLPGFESQADATVWIRWGVLGPDDDAEFTHLVKKNEALVGTVRGIHDSSTYEGRKILVLELDNGNEVRTLCPTRLQTQLGLAPKWKMKYVAEIGSRIAIKYLGQNKEAEGKPHMFDVQFGKPIEPEVKQEESK